MFSEVMALFDHLDSINFFVKYKDYKPQDYFGKFVDLIINNKWLKTSGLSDGVIPHESPILQH